MNAYNLIIVLACVIIASHIFNYISKRTNIPSVILLILLGIGGKYAMDYYNFNQDGLIFGTLEVLGIVGLIMIVLEAAIDLKLSREKWPIIWKSFTVALISLIVCAFGISLIINQVFKEDPIISLVYAVPLSIMSSAIVIPSVSRLAKDKKEFMIYESTFSDILGIMFFYFLVENVGVESANQVIYSVVGNIIITIVISVVVSYALVLLFQRLEGDVKLFMLIAVLILLYAIGKQLHLSSLVIILVFGLLLNNNNLFFIGKLKEFINEKTINSILKDLHLVTRESAFVVRTFFFVVFGTTIDLRALLDLEIFAVGLGIVVFFFIVRFVFLKLFFLKKSIFPEFFITPRGLITVLLFFSIPEELTSLTFNSDIILITIIVTSLVMTWGLIKFGKEGLEEGAPAPLEDTGLSYFLQRMSSNTSGTKDVVLAEQVEEAVEEIEKENAEEDSEGPESKEEKDKE
ncbi:cation:proton antiporter [Roseivirga sp.]|jgi:NhaP-type Na+/H+ or K+/H+ antiporter|uniref:cation:proton antiporter domain-containing protein n=1 Tax=Roseivirga sp. TaxID=1964215 RepID=UPI000D79789C|nr:cation:proton antiporter [Roseivirga sp.]MBO6662102.1 cation:proton antiporter [Roseivirga sp.]MBO6910170.1 cation:proton antiporter [Roseivirga sp.]PWL28012.1 MAG: sodium:proton exchanger [Roseivirga sp. XM-24bin3]